MIVYNHGVINHISIIIHHLFHPLSDGCRAYIDESLKLRSQVWNFELCQTTGIQGGKHELGCAKVALVNWLVATLMMVG